jgi:hypothetical protein
MGERFPQRHQDFLKQIVLIGQIAPVRCTEPPQCWSESIQQPLKPAFQGEA